MYRHPEYQYLGILQELAELLENEVILPDRTNTGVAKVIARLQRYNLAQDGFPLLTTKRVWFKGVAEELFWMLRGETNIRSLVMKGVNIWNEWPLRRYLEFKRMGDVTHEIGEFRPEDNLHPNKLRRLSRAIQIYLADKVKTQDILWYFDVCLVYLVEKDRKAKVEYLKDIIIS